MIAQRIDEGLYRILIPFENEITTTVYVVSCDDEVILIDAATYGSDVDDFILPALNEIGVEASKVTCLLLSHPHVDHSGGAQRLLERLACAQPRASFAIEHPRFLELSDGEIIGGRLKSLLLPGHTRATFAFYDLKTKTLLSSDCLQLKGIGKYRNGISFPKLYRESVERLKRMDIYRIVAAHEYDPLGSIAEGGEQVSEYLEECLRTVY